MPNITFDIFYDTDIVNITASRGSKSPKVKPAWKVRTAPKLPPKQPPVPKVQSAFGGPQPRIKELPESEAGSVAGDTPKKQIPKLQSKQKDLSEKAAGLAEKADTVNKAKQTSKNTPPAPKV